ncbi:hypothetical protein OHA72_54740 [Dactylosporangium sp. NBC_01737]|nr:hypothetical protein OHA72_54740 [Dactylosporangium sp. NBC_01737]
MTRSDDVSGMTRHAPTHYSLHGVLVTSEVFVSELVDFSSGIYPG